MNCELRCEGCGSEYVTVTFQPDPAYSWGVCLECAVGVSGLTNDYFTLERLAQANCGAAFEMGRLTTLVGEATELVNDSVEEDNSLERLRRLDRAEWLLHRAQNILQVKP